MKPKKSIKEIIEESDVDEPEEYEHIGDISSLTGSESDTDEQGEEIGSGSGKDKKEGLGKEDEAGEEYEVIDSRGILTSYRVALVMTVILFITVLVLALFPPTKYYEVKTASCTVSAFIPFTVHSFTYADPNTTITCFAVPVISNSGTISTPELTVDIVFINGTLDQFITNSGENTSLFDRENNIVRRGSVSGVVLENEENRAFNFPLYLRAGIYTAELSVKSSDNNKGKLLLQARYEFNITSSTRVLRPLDTKVIAEEGKVRSMISSYIALTALIVSLLVVIVFMLIKNRKEQKVYEGAYDNQEIDEDTYEPLFVYPSSKKKKR
ncbi:MAG: hypothetical protein QW728_07035 [Thermoplasmata archaeon]